MKVLLVGHVSKDMFGNQVQYGGSPTYQTPFFLRWGCHVTIYTSASRDYPFPNHPNLRIINDETVDTTTFSFSFDEIGNRHLRLLYRANDLGSKPLDKEMFDIAIVSPICGEVSSDLLDTIRERSTFMVGDAQGFIREIDQNGNVLHSKDFPWFKLERWFDIIKGSDEEIKEPSTFPNFIFIRTRGNNPVQIWHKGTYMEFPLEQMPEYKIIDTTGAGDSFLAGFSYSYYKTRNFEQSIKFAHTCAMENLSMKGPLKP